MPDSPRRRTAPRRPLATPSGQLIVELDIESMDVSGDGLADLDGQPIRVPFTLPGERVRVEIPSGRQPARPAAVVSVTRASPHRVSPPCPHFGPCGGCSWQHIAYSEQLRLKTLIVGRLLRSVPGMPVTRATLPGAPIEEPWGYRQKVHFVFGDTADARPRQGRGSLTMGHYARGSRRVVPVHECRVHDPRGNEVAFAMKRAFVAAGVRAAGSNAALGRGASAAESGGLRSIAVRVGAKSGQRMETLVATTDRDKRLRAATQRAMATVPVTSLHLNLHPGQDAFIFGRETRRIAGPARLREDVGGTSFLISPTAFFQTNVRAAELLVGLVLEALDGRQDVLDLYAGAGLFALSLSRAGHPVLAVEENRDAVADGEASLRLNGIPPERCRFLARPVEAAIRNVKAASAAVLDPPRDGCAPGVIDELFGRIRPGVVAYVSCNPVALARDLSRCVSLGYQVRSIQPVDMFPHTAHIETVVVLEPAARRAGAGGPRQGAGRAGASRRAKTSPH